VAFIAGASKGIGRATAVRTAEEGAFVVAASRSLDKLQELVKEIEGNSGKASALKLGIGDLDAYRRAIRDAAERHGHLDVLVHAMCGLGGMVKDLTLETWRANMLLNADACLVATQEALRVRMPRGFGSIINIGSIGAVKVPMGHIAYGASKAALVHFSRCAALEAAPTGVHVNVVAPGMIDADAIRGSLVNDEMEKMARTNTPMGRFGTATELANAVVFLASEEASFQSHTDSVLWISAGYRSNSFVVQTRVKSCFCSFCHATLSKIDMTGEGVRQANTIKRGLAPQVPTWCASQSKVTARDRDLLAIPKTDWSKAKHRELIVKLALRVGDAAAAKSVRCSTRTVHRLPARYQLNPRLLSLSPRRSDPPAGSRSIHAARHATIETAVDQWMASKEPASSLAACCGSDQPSKSNGPQSGVAGKSMILEKFLRDHSLGPGRHHATQPTVSMQMPPLPTLRSLFSEVLRAMGTRKSLKIGKQIRGLTCLQRLTMTLIIRRLQSMTWIRRHGFTHRLLAAQNASANPAVSLSAF
jgi:meso-butanediol dehydrogenase/(S,S)-butanediol dehydrogenase/diacetyl reductase